MKIMIANRGEVACRIARTAHRLGISTVGVYSEPDRDALHVDSVDVAVALGGATPAESYLRGDAILRAAIDTGCTAVHPGYGFLAEHAPFAAAIEDAGLIWIGPTPDQIRLLGDKVAAKRAAIEAGVPTTAIVEVAVGSTPDGLDFPVVVKAVAGGGGRGMRVVHEQGELAGAIISASREAAGAFGDGAVFIEPFIEHGRHVEIQIFGDRFGNVVHLGDRECSIQRRHQKVIEEAPSPGLTDDVRARLQEGALALARHVGYVGAGTVEFMVGDSTDGERTISFLEVNTRLQVEHPVTEAVTGLDLVEWQIVVAEGHPLPMMQDDITFSGHAIEARLVAEDPRSGWLPSTGRLHEFEIVGDVRVDTGVRAGDSVSSLYDSLLAKVVAHHADRDVAAARLARALRTARIAGLSTNAAMLAATMAEPDFLAGKTPTTYLPQHPEVAAHNGPAGDDRLALVVAATLHDEMTNRAADAVTGFAPPGWRNLRTRGQRRSWIGEPGTDSGELHQIEYVTRGDAVNALIGPWPEPGEDGSLPADTRRCAAIAVVHRDGDLLAIELDGVRHSVIVRSHRHDSVVASGHAGSITLVRPARWPDRDDAVSAGGPVCPLPGTVIAVHVEAGATVEEGQLLMVVEAMKMEHQIVAPSASVVAEVRYAVGDRVDQGDRLVTLASPDAPDAADADDDSGST